MIKLTKLCLKFAICMIVGVSRLWWKWWARPLIPTWTCHTMFHACIHRVCPFCIESTWLFKKFKIVFKPHATKSWTLIKVWGYLPICWGCYWSAHYCFFQNPIAFTTIKICTIEGVDRRVYDRLESTFTNLTNCMKQCYSKFISKYILHPI